MSKLGKWIKERSNLVHKQKNAMNELTKNHSEDLQSQVLENIAERADEIEHLDEKIEWEADKE